MVSYQRIVISGGGKRYGKFGCGAKVERSRGSTGEGERASRSARVGVGQHAYRISCFKFRCMIISCTEPMVILSRLVSVALVKWP